MSELDGDATLPSSAVGTEDALDLGPRPAVAGAHRALGLRAVLKGVLGGTAPGVRLGRFEAHARVGAGGMGEIFRGVDTQTGAPVAIKLLSSSRSTAGVDEASSSLEEERFRREATMLASVVDPGVVRYLDHGCDDAGGLWLAMEWLEGIDLGARLEEGPLELRSALTLAMRMAGALSIVHAKGVVHRDIKPRNIFLCEGKVDLPKLIDFGIARGGGETKVGGRLTQTGSAVGTPCYMAPEQLSGAFDARSDIYALGVTLFECIAGALPYRGEDPIALLMAVVAEPVPRLERVRPGVDPGVSELVASMMAKAPEDRPQNMDAVVSELAALLTAPPATHQRHAAQVLGHEERERVAAADHRRLSHAKRSYTGAALAGRAREHAALEGAWAHVQEECAPLLVVIDGVAGSGASSLLSAWLQTSNLVREVVQVVSVQGRAQDRGAPYALLERLLRSAAKDKSVSAHVEPLLESLKNLSKASEPVVAADRLRLSWFAFVDAWTQSAPLLWVTDDMHHSDRASTRLLTAALEQFSARPILWVSVAKGGRGLELPLATGLPHVCVNLSPLTPRRALRLATELAPEASEALRLRAVELADGQPGRLATLCRDLVEGQSEFSSLAELAWARVGRMDPELRRVVRAAAILGAQAWLGGVATLLGLDALDPALKRKIGAIVQAGHLESQPQSSVPGDQEFRFASDLLHLAAYERNTDEDLLKGHRLAAEWMARSDAFAPGVVAQHFERAGHAESALPHYLSAAKVAAVAESGDWVARHIEAARRCDPKGAMVGPLAVIEANVAFWASDLVRALEVATYAMDALEAGTQLYFEVGGVAITAAGQRGQNDTVVMLAETLAEHAPVRGDGRALQAQVVALSRAVSQLDASGHRAPENVRARLGQFELDELGPRARAWMSRRRVYSQFSAQPGKSLRLLEAAHAAHLEDDDPRSALQVSLFVAGVHVQMGAWERARDLLDEALFMARRLSSSYLRVWAQYTEGKLLAETASYAQAHRHLAAVADADAAASSPRISVGAMIFEACAAFRHGEHRQVLELSGRALERRAGDELQAAARSLQSLAWLAQGNAEAALRNLNPLLSALDNIDFIEFEPLVSCAVVDLSGVRDGDEAAESCRALRIASLERRLDSIEDLARRNQAKLRPYFMARLRASART